MSSIYTVEESEINDYIACMNRQNYHIDYLISKSEQALSDLPDFPFKRSVYHHIDWTKRLIGIKGIQGTGKTSLLLSVLKQRMQQQPELKGIYISLDDIFFSDIKLKVVLSGLYVQGYRFFSLDQIQYYSDWEEELESVLAFFPDCYIVFAAMNAVSIKKDFYPMYDCLGVSFREWIQNQKGQSIPHYSLSQLVHEHEVRPIIQAMIKSPVEWLKTYLQESYFSGLEILTDDKTQFLNRLVRTTIESELRCLDGFDANQSGKIIHLFHLLLAQVGQKPIITQLAERTGIHRNTIPAYLRLLEQAGLIHQIYADQRPGIQQKPELIVPVHPIFLELLHFVIPERLLLKLYVLSVLAKKHQVSYVSKGVVEVDREFTFVLPVEGRMRTLPTKQPYSIVKSKADLTKSKEIPVWMFGFMW